MGVNPYLVTYPSLQNSKVLIEVENDNGYGYKVVKTNNPNYQTLGKVIYELHANHQDSDISERFIEMIELQLNGVLSMKTTDGDHGELLIIWRTEPTEAYLRDLKRCITGAWQYLTAFE